MEQPSYGNRDVWPELEWASWSQTADTLHMWTQIVGKTRLMLRPMQAAKPGPMGPPCAGTVAHQLSDPRHTAEKKT